MAEIMITGASGFLGSHLSESLLEDGHKVIGVDNFITSEASNIKHLESEAGFSFIEQDITKKFEYKGKLDYILNLASPASPIDYAELPLETLLVGSTGTYNTLEMAKEKKAVYFMASTSEIYGDPEISPQPEGYWGNVNTVGPRSCYDEAKRFSEAMVHTYQNQGWVDTRTVRIFNTFGPRMRLNDGRAVPNFIIQALNNEPITVYGDGSQTRSFCYVDDLIDGIKKLAFSSVTTPVNIGNPNEMTILAMAQKIRNTLNSKSEIVMKPLPGDDPKQRRPDISKAKKLLDWEPRWSLEDGLKKTIEYFKSASS
ncbi:MAG: SDR family oxidoreductase [Nitrospinota bacterium]|nr:SDR family oxidoreductase [Nitrospinota bacterium]